MNLSVEYLDPNGVLHNQTHRMSRLAFAKHLAIAGQGYAPRLRKLIRVLSMFCHYSYYIQRESFYENRFSEPPIELSDPTEKGQFSNLAGKAIADFLSKRINESLFTVNYEAAMRIRRMALNVTRPDLLAYCSNSMIAMEAKGYSGGHGNMNEHKVQSRAGGIPVNFSLACVSYNLYNNVQCKYHDPFNDNVPYDNDTLRELTKIYYRGFLEYMNPKYFKYNEVDYSGERFYEVELYERGVDKLFPGELPFRHFYYMDLLHYYQPKLILPKNIETLSRVGLTNETKPFLFDVKEDNSQIYIDNDRIGLRTRR